MPPHPHRPPQLQWQVFRGSDAVRRGLLSRHHLRGASWVRLRQDVYADARLDRDHALACRAVLLRMPPGTLVAGPSAAYLHGVGHAAGFTDDVHVLLPATVRADSHPGVRVHHAPVAGASDDRPASADAARAVPGLAQNGTHLARDRLTQSGTHPAGDRLARSGGTHPAGDGLARNGTRPAGGGRPSSDADPAENGSPPNGAVTTTVLVPSRSAAASAPARTRPSAGTALSGGGGRRLPGDRPPAREVAPGRPGRPDLIGPPLPRTEPVVCAWETAVWADPVRAVGIVDGLLRVGAVSRSALATEAARNAGRPGGRRASWVFGLADGCARSPAESHLRVRLMFAGLPRPVARHPVRVSAGLVLHPDLAWPGFRVAVAHDGPGRGEPDRTGFAGLVEAGWLVLPVTGRRPPDAFPALVREVRSALVARGWRP
ncbi:hypothetical protein ACIA5A_16930 [Micromonospora sp. NPDC051300]|uniref:hypothetical protein n=1 Tax=Micromonospora sp. NPDC051300 TaxID=3364286 RepID=UPI00379DB68B